MKPPSIVRLTPGKRVLFLTKDPEVIRRQLSGELDLVMSDVDPADLLDDINTDVMTPAWVCFNWQPEEIAREAYAGLIVDGERLFARDALKSRKADLSQVSRLMWHSSVRVTADYYARWDNAELKEVHRKASPGRRLPH